MLPPVEAYRRVSEEQAEEENNMPMVMANGPGSLRPCVASHVASGWYDLLLIVLVYIAQKKGEYHTIHCKKTWRIVPCRDHATPVLQKVVMDPSGNHQKKDHTNNNGG